MIPRSATADSPQVGKPLLLTIGQTAAELGLSVRKVAYLADARELTRIKIGRSVRFAYVDVKRFADEKLAEARQE